MEITTENYIYSWDNFAITCYYPSQKKVAHYGNENYERNHNDEFEIGIWKIKKQ